MRFTHIKETIDVPLHFLYTVLIIGLSLVYMSCDFMVGDSNLNESGIEGTVLRGPMCPVAREDDPCPDQPFSALFHVFDSQESEVTTFQSDAEGHFRVPLSPGEYTIIPDGSAPIIHPTSQKKEVTVNRNEYTKVQLVFDTGIR